MIYFFITKGGDKMIADVNSTESMCMTCANCVFSLRWGETKCYKKNIVMYGNIRECNSYKPLKKGQELAISQDDGYEINE